MSRVLSAAMSCSLKQKWTSIASSCNYHPNQNPSLHTFNHFLTQLLWPFMPFSRGALILGLPPLSLPETVVIEALHTRESMEGFF